jgi:hypothetical protein
MQQHIIKYLDDPLSPVSKELGHEFAISFEVALDKAAARAVELREIHGALAGYRIEDMTGRTVMIGPGRYDVAQGT